MRARAWVISVMVVALICGEVAYAQCAMCKTALTSSPEGAKMADGFRQGILLLLTAPYMLVGAFAFLIFNAYRRRKQNPK